MRDENCHIRNLVELFNIFKGHLDDITSDKLGQVEETPFDCLVLPLTSLPPNTKSKKPKRQICALSVAFLMFCNKKIPYWQS